MESGIFTGLAVRVLVAVLGIAVVVLVAQRHRNRIELVDTQRAWVAEALGRQR